MSWPTGRGRRQWVSYGPFGTAVIGLLMLVLLVVRLVILLLYSVGWVAVWLVTRPFVAWKTHRARAAVS